jgi:sodium-dependent dicarboxylate transporter 2/3/5
MLPVSTPPNAIVYGTGKIRLRDMVCSGVIFDLLGALLIILYLNVIAPGLLAQLGT